MCGQRTLFLTPTFTPHPHCTLKHTIRTQVVGETPDIVAVCKPPGMPVHESGHYRLNTVQAVLASERPDLGKLLPVSALATLNLNMQVWEGYMSRAGA